MAQIQETQRVEAQALVLETVFDARAEGESRTLFERLTFRGEATQRVEAQTLVAEQGVPNLTQGVDASEKRGAGVLGFLGGALKGAFWGVRALVGVFVGIPFAVVGLLVYEAGRHICKLGGKIYRKYDFVPTQLLGAFTEFIAWNIMAVGSGLVNELPTMFGGKKGKMGKHLWIARD